MSKENSTISDLVNYFENEADRLDKEKETIFDNRPDRGDLREDAVLDFLKRHCPTDV